MWIYILRSIPNFTFVHVFIIQLVRKNDIPSGVSSCMYFWTHTDPETEHASHSKRNIKEVDEITKVAKTFLRNGNVDPNKITVLCSYRGQVSIHKSLNFSG